jgi:hypothetical protein
MMFLPAWEGPSLSPGPGSKSKFVVKVASGVLMTERSRSQVLGVMVLTALILAYACIRYYLRSG